MQIRQVLNQKGSRRYPERLAWLVAPFTFGLGFLASASTASAADTSVRTLQGELSLAQIFTFLFLMLGPFKIMGPFFAITKGADAAVGRRLAVQATLFASAALLIAAVLGDGILRKFAIPLPVLVLAVGIILFLVALQNILQQFSPHGEAAATTVPAPSVKTAISPLAFPTIVTPYGIATLIGFMAFSSDLQVKLRIAAITMAIMLVNLVVMLIARKIQPVLAVVLPILGAILGAVQVALGLEIIVNALRALGVL